MRDFNTVKNDLTKHLQLSFESDDGTQYWYEGTLEVLWEFIKIAFFHDGFDRSISDGNIRSRTTDKDRGE